ncbi:MAG: hypothetical protein GY851_02600 [bacterium]|nr:hypothetical protein [bacterium]
MAAVVLALAASAAASAEEAPSGTAAVKDGVLDIRVGDYRVTFVDSVAWTLREAWYKDKPLLLKTGWQQTVINVAVPKGEDPWIGTGHGKEVVESIELDVAGAAVPVVNDLSVTGPAFTVRKHSRLGPYAHVTNVTVDADGITEAFEYEVVEDASDVNFMYVFMHCFINETRDSIAYLKDGTEERGAFQDDMSFSLHKPARWITVYSPDKELGAVYVYPEPYDAKGGKANMFWHRSYDNKLYFQILPEKELGKRFAYTVRLQAFTAPEGEWESTARAAVKALGAPVGE